MIYSLSGAQGQGKSEMVSFLQEEGYRVLPMTKPKNITSEGKFQLYQEKLIEEKYSNILSFRSEGVDIVLESSFIDIFVYSIMILGVHHDHADWMDALYERCLAYQKVIDVSILFPFNKNTYSTMNRFSTEAFQVLLEYHFTKNNIELCKAVDIEDVKKHIIGTHFEN